MKISILILLLLSVPLAAIPPQIAVYETSQPFHPTGKLDEILLKQLKKYNVEPANRSTDAVFLRRVYLDLIGTVPSFEESKSFLKDKSPLKRMKLIDSLLKRKEFSMYWSMKWCDILRVKSEFPINLWPNAVQAYHHWIQDSIEKNQPYDKFAYELLTSSGSNFRTPAVNFYRATPNRTPAGFAKVAVQTFLCSKYDEWPDSSKVELEKLFSRILIKATDEWKEQIVCLDPAPADAMSVKMPDGALLRVQADQDPRKTFADWLIKSNDTLFAEAAVNRLWFWLFGRGLVEDSDNFLIQDKETLRVNSASNPELLKYLAEEFKKSGYDFKALCRLITNSAAYQQSSFPRGDPSKAAKYFAIYPVQRIDAEVLRDIFTYLTGYKPKYMSVIPEPFTFIPRELPTIALGDGSITSSFLEKFGRPARDTGYLEERNNDITYTQRLFLLNSPLIQWQIVKTANFRNIIKAANGVPRTIIDNIYLFILSRKADDFEVETIMKLYGVKDPATLRKQIAKRVGGGKKLPLKAKQQINQIKNLNRKKLRDAAEDLVWTLINSKEFLFKH